jgi:hypothetical protein
MRICVGLARTTPGSEANRVVIGDLVEFQRAVDEKGASHNDREVS